MFRPLSLLLIICFTFCLFSLSVKPQQHRHYYSLLPATRSSISSSTTRAAQRRAQADLLQKVNARKKTRTRHHDSDKSVIAVETEKQQQQRLPASLISPFTASVTTTVVVSSNATTVTTVVPLVVITPGSNVAYVVTTTISNTSAPSPMPNSTMIESFAPASIIPSTTPPNATINATSVEEEQVSMLKKVLRSFYDINYNLLLDNTNNNGKNTTTHTADVAAKLIEKGTPQYDAAQWILYEDNQDLYASYEQIMQRFVLAVFYFSTNGPTEWFLCSANSATPCDSEQQRWLSSNTSECDWYGIQCGNSSTRTSEDIISAITLNKNNLLGTIPQELAFLKNITVISLSHNLLTRRLPPFLPESITQIFLDNNTLTGSIPIFSSKYTLLDTFNVADNLLSGTIPNSIGQYPTLQYLNLEKNSFWGTLTKALGALTNLKSLLLQQNGFSGTIPLSLCYNLPDIISFEADCASPPKPPLVTCPCCTTCYSYGGNNTTPSPTRTLIPTGIGNPPTSAPTYPVTPMPSPGSSNATNMSPTAFPTFNHANKTTLAPAPFSNATTTTKSPIASPTNISSVTSLAPSSFANSTTPIITTKSPMASLTNISSVTSLAPSSFGNATTTTIFPTSITANSTNNTSRAPSRTGSSATTTKSPLTFPPGSASNSSLSPTQYIGSPATFPTNLANNTGNATASLSPSLAPTIGTINGTNITTRCNMPSESRRNVIQQMISDASSSSSTATSQYASNAALQWFLDQDPTNPCPMDSNLIQRYALIAFYQATGGDYWARCSANPTTICDDGPTARWLSDASECDWYGNDCINGEIIAISLDKNNLTGQMPLNIGLLQSLKVLRLSNNSIGGDLPPSLGHIVNLSTLNVAGNGKMTGTIPDNLYTLLQMRSLSLQYNQFDGTLSSSIGQLAQLLKLELQSNRFTGTIPSELGNLKQLTRLTLQYNGLMGSMPDSVCQIRSNLNVLEADCQEPPVPAKIICPKSCCTACYSGEPSMNISISRDYASVNNEGKSLKDEISQSRPSREWLTFIDESY